MKFKKAKLQFALNLSLLTPIAILSASCIKNNKDNFDYEKYFNNLTVKFDYPNKSNTIVDDAKIDQLTYEIGKNEKNAKLINLLIKERKNTSIIVIFQYQIGTKTSKVYEAEISGFADKNLLAIKAEKDRLSNIEATFIYPNKENTLLNEVNVESIEHSLPENSNALVDNLQIIERNFETGTLTFSYSLISNKIINNQNISLDNKIASLNKFKVITKPTVEEINQEKLRLKNLPVNAQITNNSIMANNLNVENIYDYVVFGTEQAKLQVIKIKSFDDLTGTAIIEYKLISIKEQFEGVESEIMELTIGNNDSYFKNEAERINEIANLDLLYNGSNTLLPSEVDLSTFTLNENNQNIVLNNIVKKEFDDNTGNLILEYNIASKTYPSVISSKKFTKSFTLDSWNNRKIAEKVRLNNLLDDENVEKNINYNGANKNEVLPSSLNISDFSASINSNTEANIVINNLVQQNDTRGLIEIEYHLVSNKNHLESVQSKTKTLIITGFMTEDEEKAKKINEEQDRINSLNPTISYINKENELASKAIVANFFITNNEECQDVQITNLNILEANDFEQWILITFNLQSTKTDLVNENIQSNLLTQKIFGFKKGLSPEEIQANDKRELNNLNITYEYLNKEDIIATQAIVENITFNLPNSTILFENVEIIESDDLEKSITFKYQLAKISANNKKVYSEEKFGKIFNFREKTLSEKEVELKNSFEENYVPAFSPLLKSNPNIKVYAISLNENNSKYYLNLSNNIGANVKVKKVAINPDNLNQAFVNLVVEKEGVEVELQQTFNSELNINEILDKIQFTKLDDLFIIDYQLLISLPNAKVLENETIRNLVFKPKFEKLQNYFDYHLDLNSLENVYTQVAKNVPSNEETMTSVQTNTYDIKLKGNVKITFNGYELKTLTNLTTNKNNNQRDWQNKWNIMTYFGQDGSIFSYQPTDYFLNNPYFLNEQNSKKDINAYFEEQVKELITKKVEYQNIQLNNLSANDALKHQLFKEVLLKNFNFDFGEWTFDGFYDLIEENQGHKFYIYTVDIDPIRQSTSLKFLLKLKKGEQYIKYPFVWRNAEIPLNADELVLYNIIQNSKIDDLFEKIIVKDSNLTHSNFLACEIWNNFEKIYKLPNYGEYSIHLVPEEERDEKTKQVDEINGIAYLQFGLYKNGTFVPGMKTLVYELKYCKRANRYTYLPKDKEWFDQNDFINEQFDKPNEDIISKINQINGTDFTYNFAQDSKRTIDPLILIKQKAWDKLNYLLAFTTDEDSSSESETNEEENVDNGFENVENEPKETIPEDLKRIHKLSENKSAVNIAKDLAKDYYIYYFDVSGGYSEKEKGYLSFKLGFINKKNPQIRWATNHNIDLYYLENDYALSAYKEALINSITWENIIINNQINNISSDEFVAKINVKDEEINSWLNINNLTYHDKTIKNIFGSDGKFRFSQAKKIQGSNSVFIKLEFSPSAFVEKDTVKGDIWYEINTFNDVSDSVQSIDEKVLLDNLSAIYGMKKVFLANHSVLRRRKIEFNYKDVIFDLADNKREVNWLFKKAYYQPLLQNEVQNAKINFHFHTNLAYLDNDRIDRILKFDRGLNVELDWNKLVKEKQIIINGQTENVANKVANYQLTFTLTDEGIKFNYKLLGDENYQIVGSNILETLKAYNFDANTENDKFSYEKAVFFNTTYGATATISYKNNIENETFNSIPTNQFNYQKMSYTQENMPIIIYNEKYNQDKLFAYDPNQNLPYKFHEGYKLDIEFLHPNYENKTLEDIMLRTISFYNGSSLIVGKASKNPKDGKYYGITNNHVVNNNGNIIDPTARSWFTSPNITRSGYEFENDVDGGVKYHNDLYTVATPIFPFWTGHDQISENGLIKDKYVDITFFLIDINKMIKELKRQGKFATAIWYEKFLKLDNLKLNNYNVDNIYNTVQELNKKGISSWESSPEYYTGHLLNGFPKQRQSGYIINRNQINDNREFFARPKDESKNYVPIFFYGGNSGTGVIDDYGNYIATINSGIPYKWLTAWYGYSNVIDRNKNFVKFDFFGVGKNGENPLSLTNINSVASNIMKLNAWDPTIEPPYWLNNNKKLNEK
ncbi:MGA_1079 family surface serine endopeptidase [Mycoplasmopsis iners]|uniref:MGA_1079 family surface serine endopeptidase n=1 Tax=Mycoplasmopsis iners TaxID=76630 RepID=UPI000496DADE|nr:lipoprotein 17-related variable surface protein [Mycoplasmopsis iners]